MIDICAIYFVSIRQAGYAFALIVLLSRNGVANSLDK